MPLLFLLLVCMYGCAALPLVTAHGFVEAEAPSPVPRYNQVQQKATHNSYERSESLIAQLVDHRVRALELDVHTGHYAASAPAGDWFVYHVSFPWQDTTSCARLSDCLGLIREFHEAVPKHEVLTVFVDLKDDFSRGHDAVALDAVLSDQLGDALVAPADLLASCPRAENLQDAVAGRCQWPLLDALRGKVLVVMTGGSVCEGLVSKYVAGGGQNFIAPGLSERCDFTRTVQQRQVVYFNMDRANLRYASEVRAAGFVTRVYGGGLSGGLNDAAAWNQAAQAGAHFLATDKVDRHATPWASTEAANGWPFRVLSDEVLVGDESLRTAEAR